MPPQRKETTAKAAAKPAPVQPVNNPDPLNDPVNSNYLQQYTEALQEIRDHKIFNSVTAADPLDLNNRGVQQAYQHDACKKMLTNAKEYHCGCNLFWIDLSYSTLRGVPYNRASILKASETVCSTPARCSTVIVALPDKEIDAATLKGGLQPVSPEEEIHAWVWAECTEI